MSRTRASLWGLVTDSGGLLFSAGGGMGRRKAVEEVNYIGRAGKVSSCRITAPAVKGTVAAV